MARPLAPDHDDKRQVILKIAARLFAERGYTGASLADIAQACGTSKARVYHYHANKEQLLVAILTAHLDALVAAVSFAPAPGLTPRQHLRALVGALLEVYRDADAEHQVQINDLRRLPSETAESLKAKERALVAVFSKAVAAANPTLPPALIKPVTMSLFGMLNWKYMWFREGGALTAEAYGDLVVTLVVDGSAAL
ncbi:MAG: TetR family transcriptional regulator, partial [Bosea sp. (in: a-proteobacteria)]